MTDISGRIAAIRALQDYLDLIYASDDQSSNIAKAGARLRAAMDEAKALDGVSGAAVDPATGLGALAEGTAAEPMQADRIDRGDSTLRPLDEMFETPDWERATGRADSGLDDLYDA